MANKNLSSKKINSVGGIKMLMLAGSVAITLGGWGMLAADQLASNTPQTAQAQTSANSQPRSTQIVNAPASAAPRVLARTRSSR